MLEVIYYHDADGHCEILDWLDDLDRRACTNKDCRVQFKQIMGCINLLETDDMNLNKMGDKASKIREDLWELRPGNNRIFFAFLLKGTNKVILLHHFRKKGQKTPEKEIKRASSNLADYRQRYKESLR